MTGERLTEMQAVFDRSSGGAEPVLDWLRRSPA